MTGNPTQEQVRPLGTKRPRYLASCPVCASLHYTSPDKTKAEEVARLHNRRHRRTE